MYWKFTAYWIGLPIVAGLCTFLFSIMHGLRSGQHLTDLQVQFQNTSEEITNKATISFRSQSGSVKKAALLRDSLTFTGEQLGPIATIDCTLPGPLTQLLPQGSVIEIRQIPRKQQKFKPRLLFRLAGTELIWTGGSQPDAELHSTLAKAEPPSKLAAGISRSVAALNSEGLGTLIRKSLRNGLLSLAGAAMVLLSVSGRRFPKTGCAGRTTQFSTSLVNITSNTVMLSAERTWPWIVLAAGLTALIVWRDPYVFLMPSMTWEDGMFYCHFLHNRTISSVAHANNGYIPLAPNVMSLAATFAPVRSVPYFYAILGLTFALAQHLIFFHKSFRSVTASDASRFCGCVAMGCIPFASAHQVSNVAYATWQQLFLLILMAAVGFRCSTFIGNVLLWMIMFLGIWSNPLSIVIVGTVTLLCISKGQPDRFWISLAASAVFYQLLGVDSSAQKIDLGTLSNVLNTVVASTHHMLDSFSLGILGQDLHAYLRHKNTSPILPVGAALTLLAWVYVKTRPANVWFWPIIVISCLALSAGSYIGRGEMILDVRDAPRYAYVSASFTALMLGIAYFALFRIILDRLYGRIPRNLAVFGGISISMAVVIFYNLKTTTYAGDRENGLIVRSYFKELASVLRLPRSERRNINLSYPKHGEPPLLAKFDAEGALTSTGD